MFELFIIFILFILILYFYLKYQSTKKKLFELEKEFDRRVAIEANTRAQKMYNDWVSTKLAEAEKQIEQKYELLLEEYKKKWEKEVRRDAIERSVSVLLGKISEHIAPLLMAEKLGINPKDLRFLGTPIDYIAFKGLSDGKPEEIIFIEVKSSKTGALSPREQAVKKLVDMGRVRWVTFNLYNTIEEAKKKISEEIKEMNL